MVEFRSILSREILDSRGVPTVEVEVRLSDGSLGRASVASGASTGVWEACELRDRDAQRYQGEGVLKALENIDQVLAPTLIGGTLSPLDQRGLDAHLCRLDGTPNKSNLGANAILPLSLAVAKAASHHLRQPLYATIADLHFGKKALPSPWCMPTPMMNILNGGKHADNGLDVQEFMIVPLGAPSFKEALRMGSEIFHALKKRLQGLGYATSVGDEGGFAPRLQSSDQAFEHLAAAVELSGFRLGEEVCFAIDCAASEWFDVEHQSYKTKEQGGGYQSVDVLMERMERWRRAWPLICIEDGFDQNDWDGFVKETQATGDQIQIVGDDLFVTQKSRLEMGIQKGAANAILIKLNQVGTLSETLETVALAQHHGLQTVVSHRSGETDDLSLVHLAVGAGIHQIKTGSLSRGERIVKYNELLRIEASLGSNAIYAGDRPYQAWRSKRD